MKISEVTLEVLKNYIRVDTDEDDLFIQGILNAAKSYVKNYTGLTDEAIDLKEDLTIAVFILSADMYDNRSATDASVKTKTKVSFVLDSILGMHSTNLL